MGVQLNIKSAEAHALAIEVAELTDQSITQAVINALKAQKKALSKDARKARIMAIVADMAPLWEEPWKSVDHGALLYDDELGLPK